MDSTGRVINYIEAPWARDANGNDVVTSYIVEATALSRASFLTLHRCTPSSLIRSSAGTARFPVVRFNKAETRISTVAAGVLRVCGTIAKGLPIGLAACAVSSVQIAAQAVVANLRGECIMLAPAPIGLMAFRYTGGCCQ